MSGIAEPNGGYGGERPRGEAPLHYRVEILADPRAVLNGSGRVIDRWIAFAVTAVEGEVTVLERSLTFAALRVCAACEAVELRARLSAFAEDGILRVSVSPDFAAAVRDYFDGLPEAVLAAKNFSNARFVRNLFERTCGKAAMRARLAGAETVVLTREDLRAAGNDREFAVMMEKKPRRLGFGV